MDPLSQGLLGAAVPQSWAKKDQLKIAALCGALGGMAPDLDVLIKSDVDPLLFIEFHRHFTHSLFFVPIGGLIVSAFLWLFLKSKASFKTIYIFTTLGFATHGLLDACTSYGTRLFWPISNYRVTWSIISIIDPIFTFTLLIFLVLSLWRKSAKLMRVGLALSLLYLGFGVSKHWYVQNFIEEIAEGRGHKVERIFLNPTIGNNILWRTVYEYDGNYYTDAVHASYLYPPILREGMKVKVIDKEGVFPELMRDSVQREDIERFSYFSKDFIYMHPDGDNVIADLRYGTLPYDDRSLWGIRVKPETPDEHVDFMHLRKFDDRHYDEFWMMLQGYFDEDKKPL